MISIIIPAYNSAKFLPETIESILKQSYRSYEIIIVDDCSTDNTNEVLKPFGKNIRYIRSKKNSGAAITRNRGIELAQGEFIAFLDADDIWLPDKLEQNIECFEADKEVAFVFSQHVNLRDEKSMAKLAKTNLPSGNIFKKLYCRQNFVLTSTVIVRKEVFDKVGLFDDKLPNCQDWDLFLRIAFYFKSKAINKPLVQYRLIADSLSKNRVNVLKYQKIVIDKIYNEFKEKAHGVSNRVYKKRLADHYAKLGRYYLRQKMKSKAKECLRESLKYNPFSLRTLRYYLF